MLRRVNFFCINNFISAYDPEEKFPYKVVAKHTEAWAACGIYPIRRLPTIFYEDKLRHVSLHVTYRK